jgi:hypothetical protein
LQIRKGNRNFLSAMHQSHKTYLSASLTQRYKKLERFYLTHFSG